VDVIVGYSLQEARRRLRAAGIGATLTRGDILEGDLPCVKGILGGIPFDVLPALVPLDWTKAVEVSTPSGRLRVVDLEGLLRLKLRAQGIQDVLDAAILVLRHPEYREVAREIARAFGSLIGSTLSWRTDGRRRRQTSSEGESGPARRDGRPRSEKHRALTDDDCRVASASLPEEFCAGLYVFVPALHRADCSWGAPGRSRAPTSRFP
jgi:hypothetical protein